MGFPLAKGSENCPEWAAICGGIRGSSVSSPLNPSTPPRRRGVKIFDFAVAVAFGDLEAQRASNLSPSNGRCGGSPPPARSLPLCKGYICAICYYLIQAFFAASPPPQKRFLLYVDTQQISRSVRSISSRSSWLMPLTTPARSSPAYTA